MHLNKRKKKEKKFNPGLALIGVRTTGPPGQQVACEQALHLGDIVKSTRARGTREETRLAATPLARAFSRGSLRSPK